MQPEVQLLLKRVGEAVDNEVDAFLAHSNESDKTRKILLKSIHEKMTEKRRALATELVRITETWQTK